MSWISVLFYGGLVFAFIAQIVNFCTGDRRNRWRVVGMILGIAAVVSIAAAGRLTTNKINDTAEQARTAANKAGGLAGFVNAVLNGSGL